MRHHSDPLWSLLYFFDMKRRYILKAFFPPFNGKFQDIVFLNKKQYLRAVLMCSHLMVGNRNIQTDNFLEYDISHTAPFPTK